MNSMKGGLASKRTSTSFNTFQSGITDRIPFSSSALSIDLIKPSVRDDSTCLNKDKEGERFSFVSPREEEKGPFDDDNDVEVTAERGEIG